MIEVIGVPVVYRGALGSGSREAIQFPSRKDRVEASLLVADVMLTDLA